MNSIELRSKAENVSMETVEPCCFSRHQRHPAWITRFHGNADQINSKELTHLESLHKLEGGEHDPPLLLAFGAARQASGVGRRPVRIEWSHKPEEGLGPWRNMKKTCFLENLIRRRDCGAYWRELDLASLLAVWLKSEDKSINLAPQCSEGREAVVWRTCLVFPSKILKQ